MQAFEIDQLRTFVHVVKCGSVTAGAATYRPADPKDWRELNRRVGPKP